MSELRGHPEIHELVVLPALPAEVFTLFKSPINRLDIRKGLIVIIAVSNLDVPDLAQVELLQAFGLALQDMMKRKFSTT